MATKNSTLVIARYKEDLEWITEVPDNYHVVVYNKGPLVDSLSVLRRADEIIERVNVGRESETYFHHMLTSDESASEWTVFCQGDPFEHSPDFLGLLHLQHLWRPVQALSYCWIESLQVPPSVLLKEETDDWLERCRVRREVFSLHSLSAAKFVDAGMRSCGENYLRVHGLEIGTNVIEHMLQLVGLSELSKKAAQADFGSFSYGAIFALQNHLIPTLEKESIVKLIELNVSPVTVYGYVCERLWLHFFGEEFISLKRQ
jgi:hypothetical protein